MVEVNEPGRKEKSSLALKPFSFHNAISNKVQQMHGDFGSAAIKAGFTTKYCNEKTKIALIKVRHGPHRIVASSLPFVDQIEGKNIFLRTLYLGATLKQCFKFLQMYQRKRLMEVFATLMTDADKEAYKAAVMDMTINNIEMT